MMKKLLRLAMLLVACTVLWTGMAFAAGEEETGAAQEVADWPSGPITFVVSSRAGGFADYHARVLADYLQRTTGEGVAVLNSTEGGGTVGAEMVRTADPDGLTLMYMHTSFPISCYTGLNDADPATDFTSITSVVNAGNNALVVRADAPWDTFDELIQDARRRPGEIIWGAMAGATSHFVMAMFEQEAGVEFKMVDAGSEAEKITALLGGFLDICNVGMNNAEQYDKAGQMKVLAVTGAERDFAFPQYPTAVEQGYDVVWAGEFMLWGPPGMPDAMVEQINDILDAYGTTDEKSAEAMASRGAFVIERTTAESREFMYDQYRQFEQMAKDLGF